MARIVRTAYRYKRMLLAITVLAVLTTSALAQKTATGDRVYVLRSEAQGSCPSLDWHMVASPDGVLTGMVAWENKKVVAVFTGAITPLCRSSGSASRWAAARSLGPSGESGRWSEPRRQYQRNRRAKRLAYREY